MIAAVCRTSEVYDIVKLVASAKKWSRGIFTCALSKAVEICRPDVIKVLHKKGGVFRDSSLQHVLKWNVEHHVKENIVCYMLMSREWTPNLIQAAMITAVDRLFVTGRSGKTVGHVLISLVLHREGNIPNYIGKQSNDIHDIIGILENQERSNREILESILSRSVQYGRRDVAARLIENGFQCCNQCLVYSIGSQGIPNSERQELVQLVRKTRDWSDSVQTEALDKALQCGLEDIARYLHDNGAKFGDKSLLNAIQADCYDYDPLSMVEYILTFEEEYEATQLATALIKSIECCNYEVMVELHRHGAKFPDGSLKQIICRQWKSSDRMRAVEYACQTRQWPLEERQNALLEAIKIGDIPMSRCIIGIGARFFDKCLAETMEKKMKPSHRLCMVKFIISRMTITTEEIERARIIADKRSETKLATFLQQAKAT